MLHLQPEIPPPHAADLHPAKGHPLAVKDYPYWMQAGNDDIISHYASGYEAERLKSQSGQLERERTRELLLRFLPTTPAVVLDVGGGPGDHACWLAKRGYQVHLVDVVPLHVEMAAAASRRQPDAPLASVKIGDARSLPWDGATVDSLLLLGPLYHLTERTDRQLALREAHRVLKPGGRLFAVGVSRFASTLDGLRRGFLKDVDFAEIVKRDLSDGRHQNHTANPQYFMDTFFHHPDQLLDEAREAGFAESKVYGVEGASWLVPNFDEWWENPEHRERLLESARALETEPSMIGISAHLMVVSRRGL